MLDRRLLSAAICAALAGQFMALPVLAQDATRAEQTEPGSQDEDEARTLDKVVVTGSLIPQTVVETATPVMSITAEDIQRQGFKDVYDVLRSQPMATGMVQDSQFTAGFTPGAEPISLLGLDPGFTLVLIDGHPMADYPLLYNGQSNFTDLSSIPTGMVERIDIAPGNLSSVYGSSAIAGVINIILKKRIDGTLLNFRIGSYDEGGGENARLQLIGGKQFGQVDLTYGLQYSMQDPIYAFERDDFDSTNDNPNPESRHGSRAFLRTNGSGVYIDPSAAACVPLAHLFGGTTIYDRRVFTDGRPDGFYCGSRAEPGFGTIMNKRDSLSGYLNASLLVGEGGELYGTLLANHSKTEIGGGSRFWQPSIDTSGFIINANTGDFESFQHIFAPEETGDVDFNNERQTGDSYNLTAGFRSTFGSSTWDYDAYFNRAWYEIDSRQQWPLKDRIEEFFREQFLGPQLGDYYGYPIYAPDEAAFYQALTPEQYRSFNDEIKSISETYTQSLNFVLTNTDLFSLPGGDVGFAAVLQAGEQFWENPTDQRVIAGEFWGLTGTQGKGERSNEALALEFRVPIFNKLTANLSGRYDRYKNKGGGSSDQEPTYKIGLEFRPTDSLLLRANYATAFKAPDMAYVFAGDSGFFTSVTDYYRCATEEPDVPIDQCTSNSEGVFGTRLGNPVLKSITADSWGYGVVWAPSMQFNLSADYYHIEIDNKVSDLSLDALLRTESACRLGDLDPASPTCVDALSRINRSPATAPVPNQLIDVSINPINISKEEVSGIVANLAYRWAWGRAGDFGLNVDYNITLDHESQQYPEDPLLDLLNEPFFSSEFRSIFSASLNWQRGLWNATVYGVRYGSTPNFTAQSNPAGYDVPGAGRVGAWVKYNTTLAYSFNNDIRLSFTVNNLLNEDPPEDDTWTSYPYYNRFNFNGYGRSFLLELNWQFGASPQ